jgi:hypothetical protein
VSDADPHSPTAAGPAPVPETPPAQDAGAYQAPPPGSGLLGGAPAGGPVTDDRPEILVGAAFAGGVVAAMLFKRLLGGRD